MKTNIFILLALLSCLACNTIIETPDWNVRTASDQYNVGEEVYFEFQGNAQSISFYSGEPFREYAFREGRTLNDFSGFNFSFASGVENGAQDDQISLLLSSDFTGDYSSVAALNSATWTDLTEQATWGENATFVGSGPISIPDGIDSDKVYVAFRYTTRPQKDNGLARTWMIQNFLFESDEPFAGSPVRVSDHANAGFRIIDQYPEDAPSRSAATTSRVTMLGNIYKHPDDPIFDPENPIFDPENPMYDPSSSQYVPGAVRPEFVPYNPSDPFNDPETETWAVSTAFDLTSVTLPPDRPIAVKGIRDNLADGYSYVFNNPGTYTVTFVAINAFDHDIREVVRQISLEIVP